MIISDMNFGKWCSVDEVETAIDKHISIEDIHCEENNRESNDRAKKFYDEILPIFYYAKECGASDVYYVDDTTQGNNFDGKIKIDDKVINIECTKAISQDDAIIQRKIDEKCYKTGYSVLPSISMTQDDFREKITKCIQNAVEKKIEKSQKQAGKYEGFHLILTLDDTNFKFANKNDVYHGINSYWTLTKITPFKKIVLYWKTSTGFPERIIEID